MSIWSELLRGKVSIYALDEKTKQWLDRGSSGAFTFFQNTEHQQDIRIKWSKHKKELWWRLMNCTLKAKGERAWVLKAFDTKHNREEILAIRFRDVQTSQQFAQKYNMIFPLQYQQPVFRNTFMQPQVQPAAVQQQVYHPAPPRKNWECAVCTYSNDMTKAACSMCGLSVDASAKAKNAHNPSIVSPVSVPPPVDQNTASWGCNICTFVNLSTQLQCNVCGAKKPVYTYPNPKQNMKLQAKPPPKIPPQIKPPPIRPMSSAPTSWKCPICTLKNDMSITRCDACHTLQPTINNPNPLTLMPMMLNSMPMNANGMNPMSQMMMNPNHMQNYPMMNPMMNPMNKMMSNININGSSTSISEFQKTASDIATYNDNPSAVFATLRSVTKKLLKDDIRYRTLDTTNPKVMERLIGFEGVLDFLMLLGFEADAMGMKLVCEQKPTQQIVRNAINVLSSYEKRLGVGKGKQKPAHKQAHVSPGQLVDNKVNNADKKEEDILTLEQIILWSTHESMRDNDTMETLLITHKTITDSVTLLKQLRRRFFVEIPRELALANDQEAINSFRLTVQKSIQLKVIKALRDWMKLYWDEDFSVKYSECGAEMQREMTLWMDELDKKSNTDSQSTWLKPINDLLKKEFQRFQQGSGAKNTLKDKRKRIKLSFDDTRFGLLSCILPVMNDNSIKMTQTEVYLSNERCAVFADQITLMDYEIFSAIEARECIGQRWKKKNNKKLAPHILGLIQQFNNLTILVQIHILRERSLKARSKTLQHVINMGERFKELRNYNSLCAIYSALNSAPIHRLKSCWKRVPEKYLLMFENFKTIFSREYNHRNLRQLFRNSPAPSIPHIGLFLQDLVFIDDGNSTKIEIANFKQHGSMVNFNKCVRITDRVNNIRLYQTHPYVANDASIKNDGNLTNDPMIQKLLLLEFQKLDNVTEDQIWDMSSEIKKQDGKEAKKAIF